MIRRVTHVPLLVRDQQEALAWYTEKLGFVVRANGPFPNDPENRWITIAPPGETGLEIVLLLPKWGMTGSAEERAASIGKYPGFILETTDCRKDYEMFVSRGVTFLTPPEETSWGISAFFVDLYGYVHDLVELHEP